MSRPRSYFVDAHARRHPGPAGLDAAPPKASAAIGGAPLIVRVAGAGRGVWPDRRRLVVATDTGDRGAWSERRRGRAVLTSRRAPDRHRSRRRGGRDCPSSPDYESWSTCRATSRSCRAAAVAGRARAGRGAGLPVGTAAAPLGRAILADPDVGESRAGARRRARCIFRARRSRTCATTPTPPARAATGSTSASTRIAARRSLQWVALPPTRSSGSSDWSSCGPLAAGMRDGRRADRRPAARRASIRKTISRAPTRDWDASHAEGLDEPRRRSTTKYIFVTGGVVSSLGKGIAAASLGRLLVERGLRVTMHEVRPVPQRRSGHDVAVPARRGLRHRRRRRDRPRPRPLRALHRPVAVAGEQRHDRPHLPERHHQGAPRRIPRLHGPGDSAHHRRDQGARSAASRPRTTS